MDDQYQSEATHDVGGDQPREPENTTSNSSATSLPASSSIGNQSTKQPRRFLAQPIQTSSRSSKKSPTTTANSTERPSKVVAGPIRQQAEVDRKPRGRLLPEPIETTKTSNQGASSAARGSKQNDQPGPRRFKPELIETDHRSVKARTVNPPYRKDNALAAAASPGPSGSRLEGSHAVPRLDLNRVPLSGPLESRFSYASLLQRRESRRHSFRVPDLPSIPSYSSEDSDESSDSALLSLSPKSTNPLYEKPLLGNASRESCDGRFSEYLLSLAARSAQRQLKEQALAAFPNEQVYEPVDHFAIDVDEMGSEADLSMYPQAHHIKSRRQSSADLSWELEYMRQHKEEAEMRVRAMIASRNFDLTQTGQRTTVKNDRASPPMLGGDIELPQSLSPEATICESADTTTKTQTGPDPCSSCGGLWCAINHSEGERGAGLWMGTCRRGEGHEREPHILTGIMTPMPQGKDAEVDPFSKINMNEGGSMGQTGLLNVAAEDPSSKISEDEFDDGFVTQIYNYLSLGYPCVARYYDHELSKISGIAIQDLRHDDQHTDAKGYVMAPEDSSAFACMRWKALRLYIREWARQQPNMVEEEAGLEAWGMPERRGSWAV